VLTSYGWSEDLQRDFQPFADQGLEPGRILVTQRGGYRLMAADGERDAVASGRLFKNTEETERPTTGDWVAFEPRTPNEPAFIQGVLPRRTVFIRPAADRKGGAQVLAANVDVAFLVTSLNADLNLRRLERYLSVARESGSQPVIVLTKSDLSADPEAEVAAVEAIAEGAPVLAISSKTGHGLDAVSAWLEPGRTAVLLGMSGVGKSTLVNVLAGHEKMATAEIREDDGRGRHTTTHRELIMLPSGGLILDTPGIRELGLWDADAGLAATFADIEALAAACKFSDCSHGREPGCAVRAAVESGALDPDRLRSYEKLQAEMAYEHRREDPRAAAENRKHWAAIHKAARVHIKAKRRGPDEE
jgi:ribosome biogenesis GTPase